ncbi:MAG: hypothetical protein QNJ92_05150 [Alphaproteobacteria bacterium]|nr:hypothetical protein [Alphaproteobacteria bacterium]
MAERADPAAPAGGAAMPFEEFSRLHAEGRVRLQVDEERLLASPFAAFAQSQLRRPRRTLSMFLLGLLVLVLVVQSRLNLQWQDYVWPPLLVLGCLLIAEFLPLLRRAGSARLSTALGEELSRDRDAYETAVKDKLVEVERV